MRMILVLLAASSLFALNPSRMNLIELYKKHYYTYICTHRWKFIKKYPKDEDLLSLVAYSCVKKHLITPGIDVAKFLRTTKVGRNNANYLSTLFALKHYIISYIKDGFELKNLNFPLIKDDLLGKIFVLIKRQHPKVVKNSFEVKNGNIRYKVSFDEIKNILAISVFDSESFIKKDKYW